MPSEAVDVKEEKIGGLPKWDVESALRTLKEAEEIKKNKKMLAAVAICAKQEISAIKSVEQLRAKIQEDMGEGY